MKETSFFFFKKKAIILLIPFNITMNIYIYIYTILYTHKFNIETVFVAYVKQLVFLPGTIKQVFNYVREKRTLKYEQETPLLRLWKERMQNRPFPARVAPGKS